MFELGLDPSAKLVMVKLIGFWSDATMTAYEDGLSAFVAKLPRDKSIDWLIDSSEFSVQSQAISQRLLAARQGVEPYVRRMALVIPTMLARMQASRIGDSREIFGSMAEARAWLAEQA